MTSGTTATHAHSYGQGVYRKSIHDGTLLNTTTGHSEIGLTNTATYYSASNLPLTTSTNVE